MRKQFTPPREKREHGFTLVEILVAISLLILVSLVIVGLVNTATNSAARFGNVTSSQSQVSSAMSQIQRDIAATTEVVAATDNYIQLKTRSNDVTSVVSYFAYTPGSTAGLPSDVQTSQLPDYSALIQLRKLNDGTIGQTVLVKGLSLNSFYPSTKRHIFDYFDETNGTITAPTTASGSTTTATVRDSISRIQFRLAATADGRGTPIQLESSATPNTAAGGRNSIGSDHVYEEVPTCAANFAVAVDPTVRTTARLSWYSPAGATGYTLYRTDMDGGAVVTTTITDPTTLSYVDTNLLWGHTYTYNLQVTGTGGNSGLCATLPFVVQPDVIDFVNINSLAPLTSNKTAGSNVVTRNADGIIPAKTVTTTNIANGLPYTVARGLTNQLSWETTYGTTGYKVYLRSTGALVTTISSSSVQSTALAATYGASTTYIVRAFNAGGESFDSNPITLISPPAASPVTLSDPDTSTRATETDSIITVPSATRAVNTDGFVIDRVELEDPGTSTNVCSAGYALSATTLSIYSGTTTTDSQATWGTAACYRLTPYNDAGKGASSTGTLNHKPGKYSITQATDSSRQVTIDRGVNLNGGPGGLGLPYCWADPAGNSTTSINCKGGTGHDASVYLPVGFWGRDADTYTDISLTWDRSYNAFSDYYVERVRTESSASVSQSPAVSLGKKVDYNSANSSMSATFKYEMPGSVYNMNVTATAANGLSRKITTQYMTRPDIPGNVITSYFAQNNGGVVQTQAVTTVGLSVANGLSSSVQYKSIMVGQSMVTSGAVATTGGAYDFRSNFQTFAGANQKGAYTNLTRTINGSSQTKSSDTITVDGYLSNSAWCPGGGSCSPGKSWSSYGYPIWWSGAPPRYWSGGTAHGSSTNNIVISDIAPAEKPAFPPAGSTSDVNTVYDCGTILEGTTEFTEGECQGGTGVPPTPTITGSVNLDTKKYTINWSSWTNLTGYVLTYRPSSSSSTTSVNLSAGTSTYSVTVPYFSDNLIVTLQAKNSQTSSAIATATLKPAVMANGTIPGDVTYAKSTVGGVKQLKFSWAAVPNATKYHVVMYNDAWEIVKETDVTTLDTTITQTEAGGAASLYIVQITPRNATSVGTTSEVTFVSF